MKAKMFQRRFLVIGLLALVGPWIPQLALAAWPGDPNVNVPICTASDNQKYPKIVSDGEGGTIITWQDNRTGYSDIYAQCVDASGTVQWTANGVAICTASGSQENPTIVSDNSGGAIITWYDARGGHSDIYAQCVDASGTVQWMANGVPICAAPNSQYFPQIVSDGSGGAIITWRDARTGQSHIYAQRVNASGTVQWMADGVPICAAPNNQYSPQIVSDGSGGAIITWKHEPSTGPPSGPSYIYAQRVNASGAIQWPTGNPSTDGVPICTAFNYHYSPTIVSDGSGGAIITWVYERGFPDIYAQRVDASGTVQWTANGVPICTASNDQEYPTIVSDGSGGAIITWCDERGGPSYSDIYAQCVDASGTVQWTANGVPICTALYDQRYPTIASDGSGGAIITWYDKRGGSYYDIYAQRIDTSGTVQWTANGVPICTASNNQWYPTIVSDDSGGAIITWYDYRSGKADIYAQRVFFDGSLSGPLIGDVSGDGSITAYDASLVLQHIVGLIIIEPEKLSIADVTGDKTISALDAALILQYSVGLITEFPAALKHNLPPSGVRSFRSNEKTQYYNSNHRR